VKSFASDNYASVHPKILKALVEANDGHAPAYGADAWTEKLNVKIKEIFGTRAEAFPVFNGTGANVISLSALLKRYEAVLCTSSSHTHVDECGAAEMLLGTKLIDIPTQDAKLTPELIEPFTLNYGNEHQVQAKVLSLTQSTERGTLYSLQELKALRDFAKSKNIKIAMDGARFSNAVAALKVEPRAIVEAAGLDVLSLGGTKNGLMLGELVVTFSEEVASEMKYLRKQLMQLSSKMRYLSAQFCSYFEDNLWIKNATHANAMAALLVKNLEGMKELQISSKCEVNAVFARLPMPAIEALQKDFPFYVWDESVSEVRWMCSFDTTEEDVMSFIKKIRELCK
jgi:threonine aldolase